MIYYRFFQLNCKIRFINILLNILHEEDNSIAFEYRMNLSKPLIETTFLYYVFEKTEKSPSQ